MKKQIKLTETQIEYLKNLIKNVCKYSNDSNIVNIYHDFNNTYSIIINNIKTNRLYLHYFNSKEIELDSVTINENNVVFQINLKSLFFKK
jgi:hypothetical protein